MFASTITAYVFLTSTAFVGNPVVVKEPLFEGLGDHGRTVTTNSEDAQKYFDQGLNFLYGFNHDEAIRSFRQATEFDPECAMAWWGIAYANGPHINNPYVTPERAKEAWDAIQKAKKLTPQLTPVEAALIIATTKRYAMPYPTDHSNLDLAYANAMRKVWRTYDNDADIGALFGEALMDLRPWDLWQEDGSPQPETPEVLRTLETVLEIAPKHPLANHLYIHAVEASPRPERANASAETLRDLQPGLGHMVHMPSHIDVRLGRWKEAVAANQRAMKADADYRSKGGQQGFYRLYMSHNHHMLAFAAMMRGQSEIAIDAIDTMVANIPADWLKENASFADGFIAMPYEVRKRFGMWDEILEMPELPEYLPVSRTMRHAARSVAYSAKGMTKEARAEQYAFYQARKQVPEDVTFGNNMASDILRVAACLMNGELLIAEKKPDKAVAELERAVAAEDQLRYDEPPDWIQPTRHTLGAYLIELGRFEEAEKVYRADLKRLPNNGWALYGLASALHGIGKQQEALNVEKDFKDIWADADMKITSSCMCLPGKS